MKRLINLKTSLALISSIIILATPATAFAAKPMHSGGGHNGGSSPASTVLTGNDISWPQCGRRLPSGQAFGIVGVNDGLANTTNPCFATELTWAESSVGGTGQGVAALYANTGNPGNTVEDWPKTGTPNQYGVCSGGDDQACAYQYGWNMAQLDVTQRIGTNNPDSFKWWLDVETDNSWESDTANNVADLEGMTAYFQSVGAEVGLYSTATQWQQIAGSSVSSTSNLNGLDSWLAGASNLSNAQTQCTTKSPLTDNGTVSLVQYVSKRTDYDFSCV